MKELKLNYYFEHLDEFTYKEIFENCIYVWEPINKIDKYIEQEVTSKNLKVNKAKIGDYVSIEGNYFIDEGTEIGSNVTIQGPVLIGKNVTIQSGALIRPGTIIGDGASVGHGSEVKHSIIQNKAKIASLAFVGDSILGRSTRIGSGVIVANRRFDQKNITIKINENKYDTNTDFFGAIIGDNSRLGANATTLPGTAIGSYTWILPQVQVRGFIEKEKRVFPVQSCRIEDNLRVELK